MSEHLEDEIFAPVAPDTEEAPLRRRDIHGRNRRRRRRGRRRAIVVILSLVLVGGASFGAYQVLSPIVYEFLGTADYPGPGDGEVQVVVSKGDTGYAIGETLEKSEVIMSARTFVNKAKANPDALSAIQPGTYTVKRHMRAQDALTALGDSNNRIETKVVIREGLWASEIYEKLSAATGLPIPDYVAAAKKSDALGLPEEAEGNVEGWLFPATYTFAPDTSAVNQLKQMVTLTKEKLSEAGIPDKKRERILTVASIVEAEARKASDRPKVARVIYNRLSKPGPTPYGLLQLDSTVSYGVKSRSITTTEAARADENPWNTYVHPGLPKGPIGNPGMSAIEAAENPAEGPWLYFVAVDPETGETKFANTLAEHQANVKEFQAWCQANPGKC